MTLQLPDPCPIDGTLLLPADVVTGELADTAIAGGRGSKGSKCPNSLVAYLLCLPSRVSDGVSP